MSTLDLARSYLGRQVSVQIDRPLGSRHPSHGFLYNVNYGFVPGTLVADGEALDAYVLGVRGTLATFTGRCIAVVHRLDDDDDKLVVVPDGVALTDDEILSQVAFQEQFFRIEIVRT
jgi:inorganic pyrophosphatase